MVSAHSLVHNERTVPLLSPDALCMHETAILPLPCKICTRIAEIGVEEHDGDHRVPRPRFPLNAKISAICVHLRHI